MQEKIEIFLSYAHEDQGIFRKLEKHLRILQRQGLVDLWSNYSINAGAEWETEIYRHLNSAQIILLLISPDFLASDYCYSTEMRMALERHARGEAWVVPVILRPVYLDTSPFAALQALPDGARPIMSSQWRNRDEAFLNVTEGIAKIVLQMVARQDVATSTLVGEPSQGFLQHVFDLAREEARLSRRDYIGTPQLFLALTEIKGGCTQEALHELGFVPAHVSYAVRLALGTGKGLPNVPILPTRRVKEIFKQLSQRELEASVTDEYTLAQAVLNVESHALQKILLDIGIDIDQLCKALSPGKRDEKV